MVQSTRGAPNKNVIHVFPLLTLPLIFGWEYILGEKEYYDPYNRAQVDKNRFRGIAREFFLESLCVHLFCTFPQM